MRSGAKAETDAIDARTLARFGAMVSPDVTELNSELIEELKELEAARRALVKTRTALANRQKHLASKLLKRQAKASRSLIDRQIDELDTAALKLIADDETASRRFAIPGSIPGIGPATALSLIVLMSELGALDEKQAASLAGLAPIARESGTWRGKRFCQGGRAKLRQAIYLPAFVAMRFNADMKATYDGLVQRGKPAKVAITDLMRKLIVLANALLRDDRKWTPLAP